MKLKQQVCSLELAKRLKELGVEQESLYYWTTFKNSSSPKEQRGNIYNEIIREDEVSDYDDRNYLFDKDYFSAFTVAELGEMLPNIVMKDEQDWWFETLKNGSGTSWMVCYEAKDESDVIVFHADTEADARAKMLIYLLENNLTPPTKP